MVYTMFIENSIADCNLDKLSLSQNQSDFTEIPDIIDFSS